MGVRRAVELACAQAGYSGAEQGARAVCTLGPLIHNPRVLDDLKRRGIGILDESNLPECLSDMTVIIRAHGTGPQTEGELHRRGARIIDATCPKVKASQLKAALLAEAGYRIFIAGEESHAEIAGIKKYAGTGTLVVSNAAEAEKAAAALSQKNSAAVKTALLAQTTISEEEYQAIGDAITRYFPDLEIIRTICSATKERQDSLRKLLPCVDALIIAGGKESANTRRLCTIAQSSGKPYILAETAAEIPHGFCKYATIGLAAGASTPEWVIDEIESKLKSMNSAG